MIKNADKGDDDSSNGFFLGAASLKRLEESIKSADKPPKFNPQQHKDETRADIAKIFTWGFFILVAVILVGVPIYNLLVCDSEHMLDIRDMLVTVSSVIGGPFGFVVGYYFKGSEER